MQFRILICLGLFVSLGFASFKISDLYHKNTSMQTIDIFAAVKAKNLEEIKLWLQTNADVNVQDESKNTPLHYATYLNHFEICQLLLESGANVNIQNSIQDSPFLYAGASGYTKLVELFLKHDADFSVYNRYGGTALIPAAEKGHIETVKLLCKTPNFPINHVNRLGWTALMEAVILSDGGKLHQDILKILIEHGADASIPDHDGVTPLDHAKAKRYTKMVEILSRVQ